MLLTEEPMFLRYLRRLQKKKEVRSPNGQPFGRRGQAVFINNTAASYHWGCYATSMAIYEALINAGYSVVSFDVETTHLGFGSAPETCTPEVIAAYGEQLASVNPMAYRAISDSDLVVVNGEGTIHRFHQGPRALLSTIKFATSIGKRVHLINHSCYPSGGGDPAAPHVEEFYRECLKDAERLVVRDTVSSLNLDRLGLPHSVGFDCLPAFVSGLQQIPSMEASIVIGAASWWEPHRAASFAKNLLEAGIDRNRRIIFLSGGFKRGPEEDPVHFANMKEVIPEMEFINPPSLGEWMGWIKSAEIVVTGRFHHFIAAAAVSAPIVYSPGNTPKMDAVAEMIGAPPCVETTGEGAHVRLREAIASPFRTSADQAQWVRKRALENLQF
ncbi:hypothetical protein FHT86_005587 [Rhizobium sp. BK313]|uniref:polysaccharide pyruvyl transferase family protein n=1 Tax=Rhizobium sp. BK313 TaxID=2587081 RepID=UPI001060F9E7|nr:polysaccharide pyruvyl transferase family protein [Rhizobium sp. BK313]MBB3457269.1 hypothetical protein [Rhizobium sp. BK313]